MAQARSARALIAALAATVLFRCAVFVPPPSASFRPAAPLPALASAAASLGAAEAAHGLGPDGRPDAISFAAIKLSKAAYPFMKEVDWNSNLYNIRPGTKGDAMAWAKAVGKMISMGAAMDAKTLREAALAHHSAILGVDKKGVLSESQFIEINDRIGHLIASVPEKTTMDVYKSVSALVDPKVPAYLMSMVKEKDAKAAYAELIEFSKVVKANPAPTFEFQTAVKNPAAVDEAAKKLSAAAYPLIKDVDWTSDLFSKPIPGAKTQDALKAVDKMIVMGANMDYAALQEAAKAHAKAIEGMDAKGVLKLADFEKINAGLGKAISSVPTNQVMDVYNSVAKLIGSSPVPNYLYSTVKPMDAWAAYDALLKFKDVVKAAGQKTPVFQVY